MMETVCIISTVIWLEWFLIAWDRATEDEEFNNLSNVFYDFCMERELPLISADELLSDILNQYR